MIPRGWAVPRRKVLNLKVDFLFFKFFCMRVKNIYVCEVARVDLVHVSATAVYHRVILLLRRGRMVVSWWVMRVEYIMLTAVVSLSYCFGRKLEIVCLVPYLKEQPWWLFASNWGFYRCLTLSSGVFMLSVIHKWYGVGGSFAGTDVPFASARTGVVDISVCISITTILGDNVDIAISGGNSGQWFCPSGIFRRGASLCAIPSWFWWWTRSVAISVHSA